MNCIVCGKEFDGDECPRCGFPVIEFPGDYEEGMRALKPTVDAFRAKFLNNITAGIAVYYGKDENGSVVPDKKEILPFGTLGDISGKECWIGQKFARLPDAVTLKTTVCISHGDKTEEKTVELKNLTEPSFQYIGITSDGSTFSVLLKNEAGSFSRSDAIPLFDD